jgi:hypothetical protein
MDSLKRYVVQHPDGAPELKVFGKQIIELFKDSNNFYTNETSKRMGTPRIIIEVEN